MIMEEKKIVFVLLLFLIPFIPLLSADVISLNSGGTGNIIINPGELIEGFFFGGGGAGVAAPLCGNSVIEIGETCDDGNIIAGDGCSATCQTETSTPETPGTGGGGGGGGGGGDTSLNIALSNTSINLNMAVDTAQDVVITVTNLGNISVNFNISQTNLDNLVLLSKSSMTLNGNAVDTFNARFVAPSQPGIYTGKIFVDGKLISVALNVKTVLLLFDSNIVVLNKDYMVSQGNELETRVTLIPMGDAARLDVTLNYVIKDYLGKVYLTKSETLLVEERIEFDRNFDTGMLPLGKYIIGLELIYPNGIAPSSAHFEVTEKAPLNIIGKIILWLIIIILIIAILILIILIIRYFKKKKEEEEANK